MLSVVKALVFAALSLSAAGEKIEVRSGHPKLFADEAEFVRLKASSDPLTVAVRGRVVAEADAFLGVPPVERVLEGRRLLTIARQAVARLLCLSKAWRMTDDRRYLERAKSEIRALCGFSDWNPSHFLDTAGVKLWDGGQDSPRTEGRRLHLAFGGRTLDVIGSSDWALEDISKPPHDYESANPGAFRATMTVTAGDTGIVEFTMETAK